MVKIKKTKVLILQEFLPHYRVEIFNKLAEFVDLTVSYSAGKMPEGANFEIMYIPQFRIRHKFHKKNIYALAKKFDVVICLHDFTYILNRLLYILPHKYKLIFWGIGVSAGYSVRYDGNQNFFKKSKRSMEKADALLFYSSYPKQKYASLGIDDEKMFVANNTVKVLPIETAEKDNILFIGSLYREKKIFELLDGYLKAYKTNKDICKLVIIGDGDEYTNIKQWTSDNQLTEKVVLTGGIYEEEILAKYFSSAIMCISPDQAGLSVLKSMGYGVPYVTHKNAITGGEIFNIHHNIDGILMQDFNEIEKIILDASSNPEKYLKFGQAAKKYYDENRTVDNMVKGFTDAIKYVIRK